MTDNQLIRKKSRIGLRVRSFLWIVSIVLIIVGCLALLFPFAAAVSVEVIFGSILVLTGLMEIIRAISLHRTAGVMWNLLFGGSAAVAGLILLFFPITGVVALTIIVATFLIVSGVLKLIASFYMRPDMLSRAGFYPVKGWGWMAVSGSLSLVLGVVLLLGLPNTAFWTVGVMIGIDLIFLGVSQIVFVIGLQSLHASGV